MTPYYSDDWLTVYQGDCRDVMASMEERSVHCVVTSPPYWGLRDYGTHGQLGLEPTPEAYVENMVAVFRAVRRVLRDDGTVWLNLGDSYAANSNEKRTTAERLANSTLGTYADGRSYYREGFSPEAQEKAEGQVTHAPRRVPLGLKQKDLVGIPWRVAFALQADGWYLRSDIIWSKPNPMPESVTDRPTKSHEYLFLLSKSPRYYFDGEAVRRPISPYNTGVVAVKEMDGYRSLRDGLDNRRSQAMRTYDEIKGANVRTVWEIATQPYPGAHFATFPEKLVEPCVKAGAPLLGVVLDPFAGSGTTGRVAQRLGRRAVLIDLNGDYLVQAMRRNQDIPLGLETA